MSAMMKLVPGRPATLLALTALVLLAEVCTGQNYHFSNGWHPGKKRSPQALSLRPDLVASLTSQLNHASAGPSAAGFSTDDRTQEAECGARLQALAIVGKMLQEEATKTQRACVGTTSPAAALRELLQGSSNKW